MRITSKGQITIPRAIRAKYGFLPDTDIEFIEREGWVGLRRMDAPRPDKAALLVDRLLGSGTGGLTTDEVMELSRGYD